jgi:flagellar motor switch protein FliN/FliY
MDVDVNVSIELGRTVRSIEEILKLAPGRIIELDRPAGENVDMYLNGKLFARGEVTVIDENYAVRVTEIVKAKQ